MEVVARDARDRLRVEPEQLPDTVVLVDDVVAHAQVGEARERAAEPARPRAAAACGRPACPGRRTSPSSRQTNPRRAGATAKRRSGSAGSASPGASSGASTFRRSAALALGLAAMSERDDDAVPGADEALELVLRLGEPARGDRRPLRLEAMRLPLRERVELGRVVESRAASPSSSQTRRTSSGCQTRSGARSTGGTRSPGGAGAALPRRRRGRARRGPRAARRRDRRVVSSAACERTLGERREGAHLLDLVAEEVDAERLATGRGEHVDDPAADGELASLVDAVDALVAGERELLREPVDARLVAHPELERRGSRLERREPVRERAGRRADEPAGGEHVERAIALADEMRRRREPGLVARRRGSGRSATFARRRRTTLPPSAASRASASSGRRTSSPRPSSSWSAARSERQHRLGDARARRQRPRERLEAVVPAQLVDERRERCQVRCPGRLVHAVRRGSRPARSSYWCASA